MRANVDVFAWQPSDIPGVPREVIEEHLVVCPHARPVRQKVQKQQCRGKLSSHEHLWDRSPFYVAVRERREHEEQIEEHTRAVYPGSGRADA